MRSLSQMIYADLAIDLGTSQIRILNPKDGSLLHEPSVMAVRWLDEGLQQLALGQDAKLMIGRVPPGVEVIQPLQDGVIADLDMASLLLQSHLKKHLGKKLSWRNRIVISMPFRASRVEKNAMVSALRSVGASKILVIDEPMAAALGAGIAIHADTSCLLIDFGAGVTDISLISMGELVRRETVRIGGNTLDEQIRQLVRRNLRIDIGIMTAERLKLDLADLRPDAAPLEVETGGRDIEHSMPTSGKVTREAINSVIQPLLDEVTAAILRIVKEIPAETLHDIDALQVILTGGGAQLPGLAEVLAERTRMRVIMADDPTTCVVRGAVKALALSDQGESSLLK